MAKPVGANVSGVSNFLSRQSQYWLSRRKFRQNFNRLPMSNLDKAAAASMDNSSVLLMKRDSQLS